MKEKTIEKLPYRIGIGIMLLNAENKVWVGKRADMLKEAWQMPQGGIEEGEELRKAALRELKEEIGTDNVAIIQEMEEWVRYDIPDSLLPHFWGGQYRGQQQKWFLMRFLGEDQEMNVHTEHSEFSEWKWVAPEEVLSLSVFFKKEVYQAVVNRFLPVIYAKE